MDKTYSAVDLIENIRRATGNTSADGIARAVARLAAREEITAGQRLPTVRALAIALGVSPSTVGEAWRTLATRESSIPRDDAAPISDGEPARNQYDTFVTSPAPICG